LGIADSKDFLSGKYTTAVIIDKGNRAFSVRIKGVIDDYFLVTIEKQRYVFKVEGQRIITWRQKFRKTMRFMIYTTDHYMPMSPQDNKELEQVLLANSLPKVDNKLLDLFNYLGKREKTHSKDEPFPGHDLDKIVDMVAESEGEYPEASTNLKNFFEKLDVKKIVTPVKRLSEFLEGELKTTDSKIFGDIEGQVKRTEKEQRAMSNTVVDAKAPWFKIIILCMLVGGLLFGAYWIYSSGLLSHGIPGMSLPGQAPTTTASLVQKYPTPESLKAAIDRGEIKLSDLPPEAKSMLDNYHQPTATPTPNPVPIPSYAH
jgi:hypothetical protein